MSEVLRRVQDLLVGDVVAHEGHPRKVERVMRDPYVMPFAGREDIFFVTFEDSPMVPSKRHPHGMVKRPEHLKGGYRLLLLESHYSAQKEG